MLVELRGIEKHFGGIRALRNGNLSVQAGEIHLLMGENGAGKSTLMKILAGMIAPDAGQILFKGEPISFRKPVEASAVGIAMVHQESLLAPHLTVAENIFLGREPKSRFGIVDRKRMMASAKALLEEHQFPLDAERLVETLSPAGKQLVEICRAIQHGSSVLIFDEPTSSLSNAETDAVFRIVLRLRERGMGVIYITHRLEELRSIGDRVTVLRDGQTVHTGDLSGLTTAQLIQHMVGRDVHATFHRNSVTPGAELLRVENLSRTPLLRDINFSVRAGEIVGIAGLIGAGRTELCRCLFGLDPINSGRIFIAGNETRMRSPRHAVQAGMALVPEDRQRAGLAKMLPINQNITMAALDRVSRFGLLNHAEERRLGSQQAAQLRIKLSSINQLAGRLSGGNQQKVVIAKWLVRGARVFLFDEPTRGIDVGAKAEVFETMSQLARDGAGLVMVSSELPELLQMADRILVMRQGRLVGELPGRTTQEEIMYLAAGSSEVSR